MKKILLFLIILPLHITAQSTDQNYIKSSAYKKASTTTTINPATDLTVNITYFDGLGRPVQKIAAAQSGAGNDIITPIVYDLFGRQVLDYLPFPSSGTSMQYVDNNTLIGSIGTFYTTKFGSTEGQNPYAEKRIESSPLGRILEQGAPGTAWTVLPASDADHTIKFGYELNSGTGVERVKLFRATATWNISYEVYTEALVNAAGTTYYPASQLYKNITKDENWVSGKDGTTEDYKNQEGQLLLKRKFESGTALDTYYIYDQFGNLAFVLPPMASGSGSISSTVLSTYGYQYQYDRRNRLVEKKLPGKQWEYMVYDQIDRLVASGPAFTPFGGPDQGWSLAKYDDLNRVVFSGWYLAPTFTSATRKTLQTSYNGAITNVSKGTSTVDGLAIKYALTTLPTGFKLLSVNYYDDYGFLPSSLTPVPATVEGQDVLLPPGVGTSSLPGIPVVNTKGMATGSWNRTLSIGTTNGELAHILFDYNGRPLRVYNQNYLGGYQQAATKYRFTGQPDYTITRHKRTAGDDEIYVKDAMTYTAQERPLSQTNQIGLTGVPQLMAYMLYDELGKIVVKKTGGANLTGTTGFYQKTDYTYTIRGWLKSINDVGSLADGTTPDLFAFKLNYNTVQADGGYSGAALYNGNISETYWRTASDNVQRKYSYRYDALNRLKRGSYIKPLESAPLTASYNETINYDVNGNITYLSRNGLIDDPTQTFPIDDLEYRYEGNQLVKVTDATNSPEGFRDDTATDPGDVSNDFKYDNNGNLTSDENKDIKEITYNSLNMPATISFGNGSTIEYLYDAKGEKLRKKVTDGTTMTITDYLSGFQYVNSVLQFFPTSEGHVQNTLVDGRYHYNYVFTFKDQVGNNRVSYGMDPTNSVLKIMEDNAYYPFGLRHTGYNWTYNTYQEYLHNVEIKTPASNSGDGIYLYKYNGKEYQQELNLNVYDYGARNYDPAIGRWMNIDPLAEKSRRYSPYTYAMDNPVYFIDPDGMQTIAGSGNDSKGREKEKGRNVPMDEGTMRDQMTEEMNPARGIDAWLAKQDSKIEADDEENKDESLGSSNEDKPDDQGGRKVDKKSLGITNKDTFEDMTVKMLKNMKIGDYISGEDLNFLNPDASVGIDYIKRIEGNTFHVERTWKGRLAGIEENATITFTTNVTITGTAKMKDGTTTKGNFTGVRVQMSGLPAQMVNKKPYTSYNINGNQGQVSENNKIISWRLP